MVNLAFQPRTLLMGQRTHRQDTLAFAISSDQTSGVYSKVDIYGDITLLIRPRPAHPHRKRNHQRTGTVRRSTERTADKNVRLARLVHPLLHNRPDPASVDALSRLPMREAFPHAGGRRPFSRGRRRLSSAK